MTLPPHEALHHSLIRGLQRQRFMRLHQESRDDSGEKALGPNVE